jgi:ppGpp synthetase/RelA/SpoT-type nucleotidyltranferase
MKTECLLREEYFDLLPELVKVQQLMEAKIRWHLRNITYTLKKHQRIEIESRIKDCNSAINALKRRQQSRSFEDNKSYYLKTLKDLVGFRVLVFPPSLITSVNEIIISKFRGWKPDHYKLDEKIICNKYDGIVKSKLKIRCEIQIISLLTGAFWDVEHFALYKPDPAYKGIKENLTMRRLGDEVLTKLAEFAKEFENLISECE